MSVGKGKLLKRFFYWKLWNFSQTPLLPLSSDCRSLSSLWTNEMPLLSHMTSLPSSFTTSPRIHHLPPLTYCAPPPPYSSCMTSPPSAPPPVSHCSSFQPCRFFYGSNQNQKTDQNSSLQGAAEDCRSASVLTNYIDGTFFSVRGEELVWRPYWYDPTPPPPPDDIAMGL